MYTIGEERNHFGYDAVHDRYVDEEKFDVFKFLGGVVLFSFVCSIAIYGIF